MHLQPEAIPAALATALAHHHAGRLAQAQEIYRQVLDAAPDHPQALHLLGMIAFQRGQGAHALDLVARGMPANAADPGCCRDFGDVLASLERHDEALEWYGKALAGAPDDADAHFNLGNALLALGRMEEAAASYRAALARAPGDPDAHNNLATALQALGHVDDAIDSLRKAVSLRPGSADLHFNLGNVLRDRGDLDEGAGCYRAALARKPDHVPAHVNLARVLQYQGRFGEAARSSARALERSDTPALRSSFAQCVAGLEFTADDAPLRRLLARAIAEAWARPTALARAGASLARQDPRIAECVERALQAWPRRLGAAELFGASGPDLLAGDPLLRALLEAAPVCDAGLERLLTMARSNLLEAATAGEESGVRDDDALAFRCALARQCFVNEYVWDVADREVDALEALEHGLDAALRSGDNVPSSWVIAFAAYRPLGSLAAAPALAQRSWPPAVGALFAQQVAQPLAERALGDAVPALTEVADTTSLAVRQQYEENPYPRWVRAAPVAPAPSVDAYVRQFIPREPFAPLEKGGDVDILVAGCGTGQQSIETAQRFPGARVLALDLSRSSLGYAVRMTRELGVANVEHAQGDILLLPSTGRTFDVVEAVGVLHHLADPLEGWRALSSVLRPGGFMLVGLYSERARAAVVAGQAFVAAGGYRAGAADIRRCRQAMLAAGEGAPFASLTAARDFYSTSECRDMLFHVNEHRFTLPQVRAALLRLPLRFLGFVLPPGVAGAYQARFPDTAATDLDRWDAFEGENPATFLGMYTFWVQRPVDA